MTWLWGATYAVAVYLLIGTLSELEAASENLHAPGEDFIPWSIFLRGTPARIVCIPALSAYLFCAGTLPELLKSRRARD